MNRVEVLPGSKADRWEVTGTDESFADRNEAIRRARELLSAAGGGELHVFGDDGREQSVERV